MAGLQLSPLAEVKGGLTRVTREVYRRELVPERVLWWIAADVMRDWFRIEDAPSDPPKGAMEILRMSEYVFHVNPTHWGGSDGTSGWLEDTACPWYTRPGWNGAHCGIFGQFSPVGDREARQSGIASVFGLRYHLSKTIPKHGGQTCRIDVKPIEKLVTLHRKATA